MIENICKHIELDGRSTSEAGALSEVIRNTEMTVALSEVMCDGMTLALHE